MARNIKRRRVNMDLTFSKMNSGINIERYEFYEVDIFCRARAAMLISRIVA